LNDSIKAAAREATKYLIGRHFGGSPRKLRSIPAIPDAGAHFIGPHAPLGLRLGNASIAARQVAVAAFYQTCRKPKSLAVRKHRVLSCRGRRRRRNPKHQQSQRHFVKVQH
jgi:hypothetical protein